MYDLESRSWVVSSNTTKQESSNPGPAQGFGNRLAVWSFAAFLGLLVAYFVFLLWQPDLHARLLQGEDRGVEWLTFAGFVLAWVCGILALRWYRRMSRPQAAYIAALSLFFFVCAGEEISWGQRLLGIELPELIKQANEQQELNLHNLKLQYIHPKDIFSIFMKLFGIILPLALFKWNRFDDSPARRFLPPPMMAICFLVPEVLDVVADWLEYLHPAAIPDHILRVIAGQNEELQEMFWSYCAFLSMFLIHQAWRKKVDRTPL